jgi:hypothetical protein
LDGESLEERFVREIETAVELSDAALAAFVAGVARETYDVTEAFEYIFANVRGLPWPPACAAARVSNDDA